MLLMLEAVAQQGEEQVVTPQNQSTDRPCHSLKVGEFEAPNRSGYLALPGLAGVLGDAEGSLGVDDAQAPW